MPFDGAEREFDERLRILTELADEIGSVATLLEREEQWCKGMLTTPDGRHCILGAMSAVRASRLVELVIRNAVTEVTGRYCGRIDTFNDARSTSHARVVAVLKRAEENVRRGMPFGEPRDWSAWLTGFARRVSALRNRAGWVRLAWG